MTPLFTIANQDFKPEMENNITSAAEISESGFLRINYKLCTYRNNALYHHDQDGSSRQPFSRHSTSSAGDHLKPII